MRVALDRPVCPLPHALSRYIVWIEYRLRAVEGAMSAGFDNQAGSARQPGTGLLAGNATGGIGGGRPFGIALLLAALALLRRLFFRRSRRVRARRVRTRRGSRRR
jgi:hypothetical protein